MKILYVYTSAALKPGSVQKKVLNQIRSLKHYGVDCKGIFLTTDAFDKAENVDFEFVKVPKIKTGWFQSFRQRKAIHRTLYLWFKSNSPDPDFIYCRYPAAGRLVAKWLKQCYKKVFFEHVTSETPEIKLYKKENPFQLNLSSILSYVEFYFLPLLNEFIYGKKIRRRAVFGISNSENIADYENKMARKNYVRLIAGDAVNTQEYKLRNIQFVPKRLNLIFLKGAVTFAEFNGLDRIFKGIANYNGDWNIHFYLYGKNLEWESQQVSSLGIQNKVSMSGFIDKDDLDKKMSEIDLGLGAFGIHRKGLTSTTTIKAREYFARGLPFIFGHHDPDISGHPDLKKCCLEFEANDSDIDFVKVIDWYESISDFYELAAFMNHFSLKHLDYEIKMKRLIDFLLTYRKSIQKNA
ncbi:MAG: hypothetical protein IT245_06080 [Bacteroidia bacterium]|nr:hypothetical protein [Bacteroidia bacterium]